MSKKKPTDVRRHDALPSGTVLHGYTLLHVLGAGGFGITYFANHGIFGTHHVIKEYLPDYAMRSGGTTVHPKADRDSDLFDWGLRSFFDEACLLHNLDHPNIVKVSDVFRAHDTAYYIMPFIEGETLKDWLDDHPSPSLKELEDLFVPLLEGLKYIHGKQLLHRDIKPDNIFIQDGGHPVLIDFGAARQAIGMKSKTLTQVLTAPYAPFEQYSSKGDFSPALDIYSLAACMHLAVSGKLPLESPGRLIQDLQPKLAENPKFIKKYGLGFLAAVDKAMSVYPDQRFPTALDFQMALLGMNQSEAAPETAPVAEPARTPAAPPPPKKPLSKHTVLIAAACLALVAIAGIGLYLRQAGQREAAQRYAQFMEEASAHYAAGRYAEAEHAYASAIGEADQPVPSEAVAGRANARTMRENAERHAALLAQAREHLAAERYAEAMEGMEAALAVPGFQNTPDLRAEVDRARSLLEAEQQFLQLLQSGLTDLGRGDFTNARDSLEKALALPGRENDAQAREAYEQATAGLAAQRGDAESRFDRLMTEGREHLAEGRFAEAETAFASAMAIDGYGESSEAGALLREAAAKGSNQKRFEELMQAGRQYLTENKTHEAERAFNDAMAVEGYADDTGARLALVAVRDRIVAWERYITVVEQGEELLKQKSYADAETRFTEALAGYPFDNTDRAKKGLAEATRLRTNQERFDRLVQEGDDHLAAGRETEAEQAYRDALAVDGFATDRRALAGLESLGNASNREVYTRYVTMGESLLQKRHYAPAAAQFELALAVPGFENDARAKDGLDRAKRQTDNDGRFRELLNKGYSYLSRKEYDQAEQTFDAALAVDGFGSARTALDGKEKAIRLRRAKDSLNRLERSYVSFVSAGDLEGAITYLIQMLAVDGSDEVLGTAEVERLRTTITRIREIVDGMQRGDKALAIGDTAAARAEYGKVLDSIGNRPFPENVKGQAEIGGFIASLTEETESGALKDWTEVKTQYVEMVHVRGPKVRAAIESGHASEPILAALYYYLGMCNGCTLPYSLPNALSLDGMTESEMDAFIAAITPSKDDYGSTKYGLLKYIDVAAAREYFKQSVDRGHPGGNFEYGRMIEYGIIDDASVENQYDSEKNTNKPDPEAALQYYEEAAAKGHHLAMISIGKIYSQKQDFATALTWYERAAKAGSVDGLYILAQIYNHGFAPASVYYDGAGRYIPSVSALFELPTVPDKPKAFEYYKQVAESAPGKRYFVDDPAFFNSQIGILAYQLGEYADAWKYLTLAHENGDTYSAAYLGILYTQGKGRAADWGKAVEMFVAADVKSIAQIDPVDDLLSSYRVLADSGNADMQYLLGTLLLSDANQTYGTHDEGRGWLRRAAEQGHGQAAYDLGSMYYSGRGVPEDSDEGFRWFLKSAENGVAEGQYLTAVAYQQGDGTARDARQALHWFGKAAEQDHAAAMEKLAHFHFNGEVVDEDRYRGFGYFKKAAELDNALAQLNVGLCYSNGWGVEVDKEEAFTWFAKAAEQGNLRARYNMAVAYEKGEGAQKLPSLAFRHFREAAEGGYAPAQTSVGLYYEDGNATGGGPEEAFGWYRKAAQNGDIRGIYRLGLVYTKGLGVEADHGEALRYVTMAADEGYAAAQHQLGHLNYDRDWPNVRHDSAEARKWFTLSKQNGHTCGAADAFLNGTAVAP